MGDDWTKADQCTSSNKEFAEIKIPGICTIKRSYYMYLVGKLTFSLVFKKIKSNDKCNFLFLSFKQILIPAGLWLWVIKNLDEGQWATIIHPCKTNVKLYCTHLSVWFELNFSIFFYIVSLKKTLMKQILNMCIY